MILLSRGTALSETTSSVTTSTIMDSAADPKIGRSIPSPTLATRLIAMPIARHSRLAKPSRAECPRLSKATQPTNIAQTGTTMTVVTRAALAATKAAAALVVTKSAGDVIEGVSRGDFLAERLA